MIYTVKLDFWIEEDGIRTDGEVVELVKEIFDYSSCYASNVKVLEVND